MLSALLLDNINNYLHMQKKVSCISEQLYALSCGKLVCRRYHDALKSRNGG